MTVSELRSVTNQATIARSPVRFVMPDGRECLCVGWRTNNPPRDAEGKPTGIPTLFLELGWPFGAVPAAAAPAVLEAAT